jgi:hypothetical protein
MKQKSTYQYSWIIKIAGAILINFACITNVAFSQIDTTYAHLLRSRQTKSSLKSSLHLVLPPLKPAVISTQKVSVYRSDDKLLNNVQVFPNPVTDMINVKYDLSRYSVVTIKIVDVLGNDIITLFNQHLEPGERTYTYQLNNKLQRGFYFVRIIAGSESVIKRISVL